jgi:beta-lactamase regulating signal transducer with metallopeptidase domain
MTLAWRTLLVTGAVFVLINAAASCLAWLSWPALRSAFQKRRPATRAGLAFAWRAAPPVLSVLGSVVAGLAFVRFEPANVGERTGVTLVALAALGIAVVAVGVVRLVWTFRASEKLARAWTAGRPALATQDSGVPAWVIDTDFPVVAVVGLRRPQLVVARSVVERCTPRELTVIMAHEGAHIAARDNLRRWWLQCVVDGLSWTRRASVMARSWQEATEDAADDRAAAGGSRGLELASALVAVARLAPGRSMPTWPVAACFYRGDGLERRVRRILDADAPASPARDRRVTGARLTAAAAALVVVAALATPIGHTLYVAAEWLVQTLP